MRFLFLDVIIHEDSQSLLNKDTLFLCLILPGAQRLVKGRQACFILFCFYPNTCPTELTDAIAEDWGGKPFVDMQKGWKYALDLYPEVR